MFPGGLNRGKKRGNLKGPSEGPLELIGAQSGDHNDKYRHGRTVLCNQPDCTITVQYSKAKYRKELNKQVNQLKPKITKKTKLRNQTGSIRDGTKILLSESSLKTKQK